MDGLESRLDVITLDNFKALIRGKRDVPTTTQLLLEKNPQYDRESEGKLEEENDLSGRRVSCFFMDDKDENFMFDHISASCSAGDLGVARMRSTLKQQGLMPPLSSNRVYHCPSIPPNLLPSSKLLEKCTMSTTLAEEQLQEATLMDIKFA